MSEDRPEPFGRDRVYKSPTVWAEPAPDGFFLVLYFLKEKDRKLLISLQSQVFFPSILKLALFLAVNSCSYVFFLLIARR